MATIAFDKKLIETSRRSIVVTNRIWENPMPERKRHAADPIKDPDDIRRVCEYLVANGRYRDNLLFTAGINLGFRCGDLLQLKWGHLFTGDGMPRASFTFQEDKTEKFRTAYPNEAVWDAVYRYVEQLQELHGGIDLDLFVFRSESNRSTANKPLSVKSVERILKEIINDHVGIDIHASTHCLRKTFGYHVVMGATDRSRAVELLCYMLNHASTAETLKYIGITDDEVEAAYQNLNLGLLNPGQCFDIMVGSSSVSSSTTPVCRVG